MTSSTSSSNNNDAQGARGGTRSRSPRKQYNLGLAGLVVMLLCLEIMVFRNVMFYGYSPGFVGQIAELRTSFEHTDASKIEVAIFGDSMSMDALRPDQIEAAAGLSAGSVFNFSLSGGSAFDIAKTYEDYIDKLPNVKQVFVIVNEHQMNDALMYSESGQVDDVKFKYFAHLGDRLKLMNSDNYGDLLLGALLKSYDLRTVWVMMLEKYRSGQLREEIPVYSGGLPAVTYAEPHSKTEQYAQNVAERWLGEFEMSGIRAAYFEMMMADLNGRNMEVTVIQLPRSSVFEEVLAEQYAETTRQYQAYVERVAERNGARLEAISNDALTLEQFRDTNHVNAKGADWVSRYVGERIVKR